MIKIACQKIDITSTKTKENDKLYAKVLLVESNDNKSCFISIDYISLGGGIGTISDSFFPALKSQLAVIGVSEVVCGTTHTHTHEPMVIDENVILSSILTCVKELGSKLEEAEVFYGKTHNNDFLVNRNIPQLDGSDWTVRLAHALPPENKYDSLAKADDSIRALAFKNKEGKLICVAFNFGCHPLLGFANNRATSNFPGIAEALIEKRTGAMAMMFQSTAGDVCEVDYKDYFNAKNCTSHGISLGNSVLDTLDNLDKLPSGFSIISQPIALPLRKDFDQKIAEIEAEQQKLLSTFNGPLNFRNFLPLYIKYITNPEYPLKDKLQYLKEAEQGKTQLVDQDVRNREHLSAYLKNIESMERLTRLNAEKETLIWHKDRVAKLGEEQVLEVAGCLIGDVVLVTAPFEPLNVIGKMLNDRYGDKVMFIGYANGYAHYGATQDKYLSNAYETRECDLDKSWIDKYFEAVDSIVKKLK